MFVNTPDESGIDTSTPSAARKHRTGETPPSGFVSKANTKSPSPTRWVRGETFAFVQRTVPLALSFATSPSLVRTTVYVSSTTQGWPTRTDQPSWKVSR